MVTQALTIDVLRSSTSPDLGHGYTQAVARRAARVETATAVCPKQTVPREQTA